MMNHSKPKSFLKTLMFLEIESCSLFWRLFELAAMDIIKLFYVCILLNLKRILYKIFSTQESYNEFHPDESNKREGKE